MQYIDAIFLIFCWGAGVVGGVWIGLDWVGLGWMG